MFLFAGNLVSAGPDIISFIIFFFQNAHFMTCPLLKIAKCEIFLPYSLISGCIPPHTCTVQNIALLFFIFYNKCIETSHLRRLTINHSFNNYFEEDSF